jgi:hypothetical protein
MLFASKEASEAEPYVWAFSHIHQPSQTVLELQPAGAQRNRSLSPRISDLQESGLKVELLFVNWPWTTDPKRIDTTFQFYEGPEMLSEVGVKMEHVPLIEIGVPKRVLSPIVVSNLLPDFARLTANGEEPIVTPLSKADIFERVPEILTLGRIRKKTPVLVLSQHL